MAPNGEISTIFPSFTVYPGRRVHEGVDDGDEAGRSGRTEHDGDEQQQVRHFLLEPFPRVQINAEKNRLEEESERLHEQRQRDRLSRDAHEGRPEQAELQADGRARHDADGDRDDEAARPSASHEQIMIVVALDADPLRERDHQWHADADGGENNMESKRKSREHPAVHDRIVTA